MEPSSKSAFPMTRDIAKKKFMRGFNRPLPFVDAPTLAIIIAAAFLFSLQGLLDFSLYTYLPVNIAGTIYAAAGASAVGQLMRQEF
jgi:hypothetical protein